MFTHTTRLAIIIQTRSHIYIYIYISKHTIPRRKKWENVVAVLLAFLLPASDIFCARALASSPCIVADWNQERPPCPSQGFAGAVATLSIVSHVSASLVLDCLLISMCVCVWLWQYTSFFVEPPFPPGQRWWKSCGSHLTALNNRCAIRSLTTLYWGQGRVDNTKHRPRTAVGRQCGITEICSGMDIETTVAKSRAWETFLTFSSWVWYRYIDISIYWYIDISIYRYIDI